MNPLLRHVAPHLVTAQDALAIAHGADWRTSHQRSVLMGIRTADIAFRAGNARIDIERSPDGPGTVTWAEIADVIRAGLTDELVADLKAAAADWMTYNHDPDGRGDLTYESCTGRFRELERQIVANGLGPAVEQLDLFGGAA